MDAERRASPDALLASTRNASRGRLKIFLGAAPGVGKTYEMLTTAQGRRRDGVDVAVGIVETHGRRETEALLDGLAVIPRRSVEYRGRMLDEMDLDAILARRPSLVLVDELAHSNAPGSRHPKRYLDVEELLAAGIDVFTTLNIQHVESLNDVVARITRIRVRETVPDSVIDGADDVEVIDLTPEDLVQRLKDGKVYVPRQADRAMRHYFSPGNLTALRELALRRTAQRVDEQMVTYMQSHAISGPWAAGDRLLVCVNGEAGDAGLVRHARRLADRFRAPWTTISVDLTQGGAGEEARQKHVTDALRLAQLLGASVVTVPGQSVADAVIEYARANNFTHVILGKPRRPRWTGRLRASLAEQVIARAAGIDVHVLAEDRDAAKSEVAERQALRTRLTPGAAGGSALAVGVALVLSLLLHQVLGVTSVALVFLVSVLTTAITYGIGSSLLAAFLSVLAYNFFFLPPLHTFTVADPENVVALIVFAIVAVVASNLTARVRAQALAAGQRARTTEALYQFSRKLAGAAERDDVLWTTAHQIASMLDVRVVILLPDEHGLAVVAGYPPEDRLDDADLAAARWAWENARPAGRDADTLPGARWLFLPVATGRGPVGTFGITRDAPGRLLTPDQRRLLDALTDQAALAIERVNLVRDIDRARLEAETDRLRSALLTSISHDLRTPLASILGSATTLRSQVLDGANREAMLRIIQEEAERLNRFIGNLLDMTKLESGPLDLATGPADLSDAVGAVLQRSARILADRQVAVTLEPGLPMLAIDEVLFDQVLFNLLDNAAKYSPPGSGIRILGRRDGDEIMVQVVDEGDGIPPDDLSRVFEKFHRVHRADRGRAGTGLGLAICRGFVEAMHGTISAANRSDRSGAIFTIRLPVPAQLAIEEDVT